MAGEPHGVASWPGAIAIESCQYTISHGISPGTAILRMQPQADPPAVFGDLTISDGDETITVPDCKLLSLKVELDESGQVWVLEISDRRWRWRDLGDINGSYNQLDPHGKLIPWTIRSPEELAEQCLLAMGEQDYTIDLPEGLAEDDGKDVDGPNGFLGVGDNLPPTGTNPPVEWRAKPPAQALAELADQYGRRVVYELSTNSVLLTVPGAGADLPAGSIARGGPTQKAPVIPDAVGVTGAPTRYQVRVKLIAVGEEWDGSYRPINLLSYAPLLPGKKQISTATAVNTEDGLDYQVFIGADEDEDATTGALFEAVAGPGDTELDICNDLMTLINASNDPRVNGKVVASVEAISADSAKLIVTGTKVGEKFQFLARLSGSDPPAGSTWTGALTQAPSEAKKGWQYCGPPSFPNVQATDRLTFDDARRLAQKSVFRCYQVDDTDVSGEGPINVPGYGPVVRKQQLVLQDTQVDQIVPQPNDENILNSQGRPLTVNLYNGYSRDKPAVVYGSISSLLNRPVYFANALDQNNTPAGSQVFVPFSIDPVYQVVTFSNYVYSYPSATEGLFEEPKLVLQTTTLLRDSGTNQFEAFRHVVPTDTPFTGAGTKMSYRPDIQLNVTSSYDDKNNLTATDILETDPLERAVHYTEGMKAQYFSPDGEVRTYNGIVAIDLDGAVQQVTWSVSGDGAETTASRNTEHSIWVPPYPARRRAENLPPAEPNRIDMTDGGWFAFWKK